MWVRLHVGIDGRRCVASCRWRAGGMGGEAFLGSVNRNRRLRHRQRMRSPRPAEGETARGRDRYTVIRSSNPNARVIRMKVEKVGLPPGASAL